MKHIKLFDKFSTELNEAFSRETVFYKIINYEHLESIKNLGLLPGKDGGTYVIAEENFDDWLVPNNLFGSLLQALLFFPATKKQKCALLKIKAKPDKVKVRNVSLMLKDMKKWKDSMIDIDDIEDTDFEISEYIIMDLVDPSKIEVVNEFMAVEDIKKFKIEPKSLKDYIFGLSTELVKVQKISMPRLILKFIWLKLKSKFF
jgi:hypothetical protein